MINLSEKRRTSSDASVWEKIVLTMKLDVYRAGSIADFLRNRERICVPWWKRHVDASPCIVVEIYDVTIAKVEGLIPSRHLIRDQTGVMEIDWYGNGRYHKARTLPENVFGSDGSDVPVYCVQFYHCTGHNSSIVIDVLAHPPPPRNRRKPKQLVSESGEFDIFDGLRPQPT